MPELDARQHVAVIDRVGYNRYRLPCGQPALDPAMFRVALLTPVSAAAQVRPGECSDVMAFDMEHIPTVITILEALHHNQPFDRIIAFPESHQLPIAQLRDRLGIAGPGAAEILAFRDKLVMKRMAAAGGLAVADCVPIESAQDVEPFLARHGRVFIKPRTGTGSAGVYPVSSPKELKQLGDNESVSLTNYQAEEFIDAPMLHIDAVVSNGRPTTVVTSRYLSSTTSHLSGQPLASVMVTDPDLQKAAEEQLEAVLKAFSVQNMVLHLESFVTDKLIFNEVACRPGGGGITTTVQALTGYNIFESHIRLSLCESPSGSYPKTAECAGFLMLYGRPALYLGVDDNDIPESWILEKKFAVLPGERYEPVGRAGGAFATYIVQGRSEDQVRDRISTIQNDVRLLFDD